MITLPGQAVAVTVTIQTVARSLLPPAPGTPSTPAPSLNWRWLSLALLLFSTGVLALRRRGTRLGLALLLGSALLAAGCGGISNLPTAGGGTPPASITSTSPPPPAA